jgi:acetyl-CoA acetyltransferase
MTPFGKFLERGLKSLGKEAIEAAIADAGIDRKLIQAAYMGSAAAGIMTGQVMIAGQAILRGIGLGKIPVVNVENACATSSTAFQQAATMITLGAYDVVLVAGYEKLHHLDKERTFSVFRGAVDVEDTPARFPGLDDTNAKTTASGDAATQRSLFMDLYAAMARSYMQASGATPQHFAMVAAKNSLHGSFNEKAQYRDVLTVQQVLSARPVVDPLTLPMCSPLGDGAAALVLVSARKARELGLKDRVRVLSSTLASGWDYSNAATENVIEHAAHAAYEDAAVGPTDLNVVELHDAAAPAELIGYEHLGLAQRGHGVALLESGATRLGGRLPVNPSGGLLRKGHPIGATGCAQLVELAEQLRGRCGRRQVDGARTALAENGGGWLGTDAAAIVISILQRE